MGSAKLTDRQQEILDFIKGFATQGLSPTVREIAEHFGFSSVNAVVGHLKALEKKGKLKKLPTKARAIVLIEPGPTYEELKARVGDLEKALKPFAHYGRMRAKKPLYGLGEDVHKIHEGTEWAAEITLHHCLIADLLIGGASSS